MLRPDDLRRRARLDPDEILFVANELEEWIESFRTLARRADALQMNLDEALVLLDQQREHIGQLEAIARRAVTQRDELKEILDTLAVQMAMGRASALPNALA